MSYIGNTSTTQSFAPAIDYFNGNGSTTAFTLSRPVASVAQIQVVINNVAQNPYSAYSVSGNTITFTSAPSAGTSNIYVQYTSPITQIIQPSQGSVGLTQLASNFLLPESQGGTGTAIGNHNFKNRIINGNMMIDQRNAGVEINPAVGGTYYLDRWNATSTVSSKFKIGQNAGAVTPPTGYINYLGCTSLSAYAVIGSDNFSVFQRIEGLNIADLAWGTASAATVTLSFWVYSSLTGTFGGSLRNSANTRSYPFTYTISSANTWTQASITIAGDTSGTWLTTNGIGIQVNFGLGIGPTLSGTAGAWAAANYASATGAVSVVGTSGATFYITGVQLEKGSTATSFDYRPYGAELALCQRYYLPAGFNRLTGGASSITAVTINIPTPVTMRAIPTITGTTNNVVRYDNTGAANMANATYTNVALSANNIQVAVSNLTSVTDSTVYWVSGNYFINAEL